MFTIQFQGADGNSHMQMLDTSSRTKLIAHLLRFPHTILAVYEQASPITKAMQKELADWPGQMTQAARDFASRAGTDSSK